MQVSKAELVNVEHSITHEIEGIPYTFFSLDASEKAKYNAFREKHNDLERTIDKIRREGGEIKAKERQERENGVQEMFVELVKPYLNQVGLEAVRCFAGYGEDKKTFVETPYYVLFENNEPFEAALRIVYWFSTKDETLSCTSNLDYRAEGSIAKSPQRHTVYDLLRKYLGERKQDGASFPIVSFRGDFVYFASSEFAMPLIGLVRDILEKVGPEEMKELNVLYTEYMKQKSYGSFCDTAVEQRVFKEAYERKLETELVRSGFIKPKLMVVK